VEKLGVLEAVEHVDALAHFAQRWNEGTSTSSRDEATTGLIGSL
jgi:hypothetical protein